MISFHDNMYLFKKNINLFAFMGKYHHSKKSRGKQRKKKYHKHNKHNKHNKHDKRDKHITYNTHNTHQTQEDMDKVQEWINHINCANCTSCVPCTKHKSLKLCKTYTSVSTQTQPTLINIGNETSMKRHVPSRSPHSKPPSTTTCSIQ